MDYDKELNELLDIISEYVNYERCREADERSKASLLCEYVDRPPLVIQATFGFDVMSLPYPWDRFKLYSYKETFDNPAAMLQNALLERVVPGLILKDDNPLAIRNNHGTIQIASILGGKWMLFENNNPWIEHFDRKEDIERIAFSNEEINLNGGILQKSLETLKYYHEKLREYPSCYKAIQISIPDLEGPINTAEQLWGSDIYYAFYDEPQLLHKLFGKITDTMLDIYYLFRRYSTDRLLPVSSTQHFYQIPGNILIRDDSSIIVSPELYEEFIMPYDAKLLAKIGGGSIHFCGDGAHLISKMTEIKGIMGLDFGQPWYMDIGSIYANCREKKIALTHLSPSREDLISGKAAADFPTGAVFVYYTNNIDDAKEVIEGYQSKKN